MQPRNPKESGIVLLTVLLLMLILSAIMAGFFFTVLGEQQVARSGRDNVVAFYGAEGGLEQLSAGLAQLFESTASPAIAQINALSTPTYTPPHVTYLTYTVGCPDAPCTNPIPSASGVIGGSSPLAGLPGIITPFTLTVVANSPNHTQVKLVRQVQLVAVPIFEFGIFSQTDLSFFAGPNFDFGGRVHTNGYLFLAEGDGHTLTLSDKVTAYKDIIRAQLANGVSNASSSHAGTVNGIVTVGGCPGSTSTCRPLDLTEGSVTGGPGSSVNPSWHSLSLSIYNANIRNGDTGAKRLNLAIALAGAQPVDLIRRALPTDTANTAQERLMNKASLRILLSDTAAALPGKGTNDANGYPAVIPLGTTLNASLPLVPAGTGGAGAVGGIYDYVVDPCHPPIALSSGPVPPGGATNASQDNDFMTPTNTPLLGGFIEIDIQLAANPGTWTPVTMEILQQGIERPYTNTAPYTNTGTPPTGTCVTGGRPFYPIVHLEQINTWARSGNSLGAPAGRVPGSTDPWDYMPLNMYDTREGSKRDTNDGNIYLNGVMSYVELDVANLQRWFACNGIYTKTGFCSGTLALGPGPGQANEIGGYIVYFSDRRGNYKAGADNLTSNPPLAKNETGEYGNEDTINTTASTGAPDRVLEPVNYNNVSPEDVNGNGALDTYGVTPDPYVVRQPPPAGACILLPGWSCMMSPFTTVNPGVAAKNSVVFFRRALHLSHGALGQLPPYQTANCTYTPTSPDGYGGFTVVAENPVYIAGDYNADSSQGGTAIFNDMAGRCHVPAAVMADAVTLLSGN
jgi:hypothetical protein